MRSIVREHGSTFDGSSLFRFLECSGLLGRIFGLTTPPFFFDERKRHRKAAGRAGVNRITASALF